MENINFICFNLNEYDSTPQMWKDIAEELRILIKNGYICTVEGEDSGHYLIKYSYNDESFGTPYPYWITPDQYELLQRDEYK